MTDESSLNNAVVVKNNHANSTNNNGALILHQQPTDEVQRIMRKYVSNSTMTCYKNELVTLMFYLFDKDPEKYFHDWIRDNAIRANEKDGECIQTKTRKHLRQVLKDSLEDVRKSHCPIILETLDFYTFSHYVTTRKMKDGKLLSKSAYGGMQSALMYLDKMAGFVASDDFRRDLLQFNRGMKRKVTDQKLHTGSSLEEGKKAMNFDVYKLMYTKLIKMETPEANFCYVEKAAKIVNLPHLIKRKMTDKDAITLYNSVKHLFRIPAGEGKRRRYETLSWKTYYNMLSKRKWRLYGEKETARKETVTRVEHLMSETDKQAEQRGPKKRQRTLNTQKKKKRTNKQ